MEQLYFINFAERHGDRVQLAGCATARARQPYPGYRKVSPLVYRLLRWWLRREFKTTRGY